MSDLQTLYLLAGICLVGCSGSEQSVLPSDQGPADAGTAECSERTEALDAVPLSAGEFERSPAEMLAEAEGSFAGDSGRLEVTGGSAVEWVHREGTDVPSDDQGPCPDLMRVSASLSFTNDGTSVSGSLTGIWLELSKVGQVKLSAIVEASALAGRTNELFPEARELQIFGRLLADGWHITVKANPSVATEDEAGATGGTNSADPSDGGEGVGALQLTYQPAP